MMVIAAVYAPLIASFGSLFQYFQSTLAYLVPPVVAVYLGGLLARRLTRASAFWALVIVEPVALGLYFAQEVAQLWQGLHFTYMAMILLAATLAIMTGISAFAPGEEAGAGVVAGRHDLLPEPARHGGLGDYRVQAALLLGVIAALLVILD
jgi:SSS family solute:Na+ symporter